MTSVSGAEQNSHHTRNWCNVERTCWLDQREGVDPLLSGPGGVVLHLEKNFISIPTSNPTQKSILSKFEIQMGKAKLENMCKTL